MYEVENIVNVRIRKGKKEYEVKWKGYDSAENTWEPEQHLDTAQQLLEEFEKKRKAQMNRQKNHNSNANNMHQNIRRANSAESDDRSICS